MTMELDDKLDDINEKIKNIKRSDSQQDELLEKDAKSDPFEQFVNWFSQALTSEMIDPSVMVITTVDEANLPDSRVVLLKELLKGQFVFYTNYHSKKASQLINNNVAALNFYWPRFSRQIRIRGHVEKVIRKKSQAYFSTRPREAQLGAHAWIQSSTIDREEMSLNLKKIAEQFESKEIPCPNNWGGYVITPFEYEFFQGRIWRMHDRLLYTLKDNSWKVTRLAP